MTQPTSHLLDLLINQGVAQKVIESARGERDRGLADATRYPFLALVGQSEMKMALLLALVNRHVGGVLLVGPRGTGKTSAVRGLIELMPMVQRSACPEGCDDEAAQMGEAALCANCIEKVRRGEPLTYPDPMRLVELPLNARLDDVVGGVDERKAIEQNRVELNRGLLSLADRNMLYIDEVNLLDDTIISAILDAAAQGIYTVRRGPVAATYNARLFLVGSMNPEEGLLRPQLQDRFGLRVIVRALKASEDRLEMYRRAAAYRQNPYQLIADWRYETQRAAEDIQEARDRLPRVTFEPGALEIGIEWIQSMQIESHRAEITLFEAARAYAALDQRELVTLEDLRVIAPLALRQRQSAFMSDYVQGQHEEDQLIRETIASGKKRSPRSRRNNHRAP